MRVSKLILVLLALTLAPLPAVAAENDATLDAALEKAVAGAIGETAFQEALRSVAPRFRAIEFATEPGRGVWNHLTWNERGKRVDAIRVRTPAGDKHDLVWAFSLPKSVDRWYILPVEGEMQGFRNFWKVKTTALFGPDAAPTADAGIVQMLDAKNLEPDKEYLLWFTFKDEKPVRAWVMLSFMPPGKSGNVGSASKNLGLPKPVEPPTAK